MKETKIKIRLTTPGLSLNVEVPEEKFMDAFREAADTLFAYAKEPTGLAALKTADNMFENVSALPEIKEPVKKEETLLPAHTEPLQQEDHCEEPKQAIPTMQTITACNKPDVETRQGYKGFLLIKCNTCGRIHAFNSRTITSRHQCRDCNRVMDLENLVPLQADCECGQKSRYRTNIEEPMLDVTCIACGNPVTVEWNSKKKYYQTVREVRR